MTFSDRDTLFFSSATVFILCYEPDRFMCGLDLWLLTLHTQYY